jgi:hypothetical protein
MKHDCNLLSILAVIGFLKIICVGKKRQLIIFALRESNNYPDIKCFSQLKKNILLLLFRRALGIIK